MFCSYLKHTRFAIRFSCLCSLWTKTSFFCAHGFTFCITILFLFHVLFILKHTQFGMSLLFSELIHTQQDVKLFGPAFSSPAIWSVIFQLLHFHALRLGPSFSRFCIFQVLHFQSPRQWLYLQDLQWGGHMWRSSPAIGASIGGVEFFR